MEEIDFSEFETDAHSYGGSDSKKSICFNGKYYMVKMPNEIQTQNSLQTSVSNNVISEYIGSHIMQSIGLETQNTLLGYWHEQIVVACEDFREDGDELHEFSWYMQNILPKNEIGRIPTYHQLYRVFEECPFLKPICEKGIERYWDIIVGDALIGNFDRHKDNFGFLTNKNTGMIKLAPVYDCGSSLYPSLSEEKFDKILSSQEEIEQRIYQYPKIALNRNDNKNKEDKFGYFELLSSDFDENLTRAFFGLYEKIDMLEIYHIIEETPFISDTRKEFYEQMLMYRKELILDQAYKKLNELESVKKYHDYYYERCHEKEKQIEQITRKQTNYSGAD